MTKSIDDLKEAFAGESQANRRYLAFAKKADDEGYPQAARLFRAAAAAETVHALNHIRAAGEVKSTAENLQAAISGENYEHTVMYPGFIADAEKEQDKKALTSFRFANEVEKIHEGLYQKTLNTLSKDAPVVEYYICPVCGNTFEGSAPDRCPICNTPAARFEKIS
jgi:rubrerythrin